MDRRQSLQAMAGTVGLLALGKHAHALARMGPLRVLSPHQDAVVRAASACIIPGAEVDAFIDTMLADWYTPAEQNRFLSGVSTLDEERFLARTPAEQTALIARLDNEANESHWFAMLKFLTIWGYYTSEVAQTRELGNWPLPWRYDGNAPYTHPV